ncbi:MAG: TetR/AcrR family transcriptional regulator [Bacteroidales bacterium]
MSPRTREQFEEIRESRKDLIRGKALKLFALEGYHTTSIQMIAKEAGISKGLIYNYYESKEDLLKDVIISGMKRIFETVDPNEDGVLTDEEMKNMLEINKRSLVADRRFWTLYFSILPQPNVIAIVKDEVMEMYEDLMSMFTEYFKKEGYDDPETEAMMLASILDGVSFHYLFNPNRYPLDKVIDRLITIYSKNNSK